MEQNKAKIRIESMCVCLHLGCKQASNVNTWRERAYQAGVIAGVGWDSLRQKYLVVLKQVGERCSY